jgi:hypothetical protein
MVDSCGPSASGVSRSLRLIRIRSDTHVATSRGPSWLVGAPRSRVETVPRETTELIDGPTRPQGSFHVKHGPARPPRLRSRAFRVAGEPSTSTWAHYSPGLRRSRGAEDRLASSNSSRRSSSSRSGRPGDPCGRQCPSAWARSCASPGELEEWPLRRHAVPPGKTLGADLGLAQDPVLKVLMDDLGRFEPQLAKGPRGPSQPFRLRLGRHRRRN